MTATQATAEAVERVLVWLEMDQAELDRAYDQTHWAPNMKSLAARRILASEATIARLGEPETIAYGPTPVETYELFRTKAAHAPTLIFIHGGAWRTGRAREYALLADAFVNAGAHFVGVDFSSVDDAAGSLFPMVEQVRRAVVHVYKNAATYGADPERIFVAGHSSGAHLAGNIAVTDWQGAFGLPKTVLKGVLLSSGMYDLAPVRLSARSKYVAFTDEMEAAFSSIRHLDHLHCPVILAYGTLETPEFQRQSRHMAEALEKAGKPMRLIVAEGYNHFEMLEGLANPYGLLAQPLFGLMGIGEVFQTRRA